MNIFGGTCALNLYAPRSAPISEFSAIAFSKTSRTYPREISESSVITSSFEPSYLGSSGIGVTGGSSSVVHDEKENVIDSKKTKASSKEMILFFIKLL
jgi:hypothetical protein